jgi:hypothetical protein
LPLSESVVVVDVLALALPVVGLLVPEGCVPVVVPDAPAVAGAVAVAAPVGLPVAAGA